MKVCPQCDERFDEEVIKFCTRDGTPLIEEEQPKFTALPSENMEPNDNDDIGEETVIRRNPDPNAPTGQSERIVIPTAPEQQQVRHRPAPVYYPPPPPQPSTGKTIVLTILGTLFVLGCGAGLFWLLRGETAANVNVNTNPPNQNMNMNANSGFDSNFNFNTNGNFSTTYDLNTTVNTNTRTPTPTQTPRPSPTATPLPTATPAPTPTATPRPSPTATPRMGPRPPGNTNGNL